ncbi:hypothetical protein M5D96_006232 [Drosophila gunungcola]|uniref:Uncharacterized protein n=1 Tax=Drosophila gunungcola TaxID=103775 RepID=A0A9Q0BPU0_9MUSC|nr:hypothetical protein M5D96_006232 [Drosophila gunungcola]
MPNSSSLSSSEYSFTLGFTDSMGDLSLSPIFVGIFSS